ncbi:MAG: hypothetical protein HYV14_16080 [Elusimicrobia bacterium]|nr:hypothetical protein [Elusimicrobiota bacterium]
MRNALIRLAPCAVFLSALASAQVVEKPVSGGTNTGSAAAVPGTGANNPSGTLGGANATGLGLQPGLGLQAPSPVLNNGAAAPAQINPVSAVPVAGAALPIRTVGSPVKTAAQPVVTKAVPVAQPGAALRTPGSVKADAPGAKDAPPSASSTLDATARGITQGAKAEAAGGDGLSVRQALDRAYDSSTRGGDVAGGAGVAGKFSSAREKVAGLVGVANNSAPADAPGLYASAVKTAAETLPSAAAAAVTKAVLSFAARKADMSLTDLAQAAYTAAADGQATEARRLVKSLDKWEELLGAPGRPLISNGDRLKAGVENALAESKAGAKSSAPRVWVVKRGGSYVAALPGTTVEKVPGLAASFALKLEKLSLSPMSDAYRAFAAKPGVRAAVSARVSLGESVPSAVIGTGWTWLKHLVLRAWNVLTALLPGRGLPSAANESTMPRLREAALAWREAATAGDSAARAAGAPRLTVSRARGAFALALKAAAAHESLTGEAGAVSRVESLSAEFEAGVKRASLSPADRLTPGLESIVAGAGGLRHWSARYASDARERGGDAFAKVRGASPVTVLGDGPGALAAATLAAASKELRFTAFGDALWASGSGAYGEAKLSADLRSTESGGSLVLETERGDEALASSLDELGFAVTRRGRGLSARLDAETVSADAREMTELAADGAALITGAPRGARAAAPFALARLLADMKRAPKDAAKTAASLDGTSRLSRAKTVGWVGEYEAVSAELASQGVRVIALRDPATGLPKFARIEPLRVK